MVLSSLILFGSKDVMYVHNTVGYCMPDKNCIGNMTLLIIIVESFLVPLMRSMLQSA